MPRNTSGQRQGRAERGPGGGDGDNAGGRVHLREETHHPLRKDHRATGRGEKASNGLFRADKVPRKDC